MPHYLSKVFIRNFRACKEAEFPLSEYTPIVGYNNAGKSSILQGIEWLIKDGLLNKQSYHSPDSDIVVEGVIEGISDEVLERLDATHREPMLEYITNETIKIKRVQPAGASKKSDVKLFIEHPTDGYRPNPRGILNAISALFPDPIRIGAMEDAEEDVVKAKTSTTIGKLLAELCEAIREESEHHFNEHISALSSRVGADGGSRLESLGNIDSSINVKIGNFFPGIGVKLHFNIPTFDEIFKSGTVKVYEDDGICREFGEYGHGAQRSIQMALIQELAEIKRESRGGATTLLLIDEPELYLHPFAIEQVREALFSLSESGYQVLFSTHSPQMITSDKAQHTLLVRKNQDRGTHCRKRLADALGVVVPEARSQAEHLFALTQSTEVLFSNKVILTEGKTEIRLLPHIYRSIIGATFKQGQTGLIETGSVDNIAKTMAVLHEMDIPCKAVVDLDYAFKGAIRSGFLSENDEDIISLRAILTRMCESGEIDMRGDIPGAKHCTSLAAKDESIPFINSIHEKLLRQNIWIWKKGAIEAHLGLRSKDEVAWADFKERLSRHGVTEACSDYELVEAMARWLA